MAEPWEKACPTGCTNGYWPRIFSEDLPCSTCRGTGYIPMTTSEMLEALGNRFGAFQLRCVPLIDGTLLWYVAAEPGDDYADRDTPDDALRAAQEAVSASA